MAQLAVCGGCEPAPRSSSRFLIARVALRLVLSIWRCEACVLRGHGGAPSTSGGTKMVLEAVVASASEGLGE